MFGALSLSPSLSVASFRNPCQLLLCSRCCLSVCLLNSAWKFLECIPPKSSIFGCLCLISGSIDSRVSDLLYISKNQKKEGSLIISHLPSAFKLAQWQQHAGLWNPLQKPRKDDCVIPMISDPTKPREISDKERKKAPNLCQQERNVKQPQEEAGQATSQRIIVLGGVDFEIGYNRFLPSFCCSCVDPKAFVLILCWDFPQKGLV